MKRAAYLALGLSVFAGPVLAADSEPINPLDQRRHRQSQPALHGFYAGLNAGGGFGGYRERLRDSGVSIGSLTTDLSGFVGGGQLGVNFNYGGYVWGVEGDIQATSLSGSESIAGVVSRKIEVPWFATLRLRGGFAMGPTLYYMTGGLAHVRGKGTISGFGTSASSSESRTGWTIGAGIEQMVARNWTWKIEYLYIDTGNKTENLGLGYSLRTRGQAHIIRLGMNHLFGR